jgi:NADH:ubiquinone oxidoreductase subunit
MNENHKSQTLRWGIDFSNHQILPFVSVQLESDTSNVQLTQSLRSYAGSNEGWTVISENEESAEHPSEWNVWNNSGAVVSASSSWNKKHGHEQAKLNLEEGIANWSTKTNDLNQWIQADFGEKKLIQKLAIQGRYNREQWVSKFKILVSVDGKKFEEIGAGFEGNCDQKTVVEVALESNAVGRYVRIVPTEWHGHISMRFDVQTKNFSEFPFEINFKKFTNNLTEMEFLSQEISTVVSDLQKDFPGKFGLAK